MSLSANVWLYVIPAGLLFFTLASFGYFEATLLRSSQVVEPDCSGLLKFILKDLPEDDLNSLAPVDCVVVPHPNIPLIWENSS